MPATAHDQDASVGDPSSERKGLWSGINQAHAMGVDLVAAILVWSAIGYFADVWLATTPWLLVTGAFIGYAAGLYLVWMRSNRMNAQADRERAQRWASTPAAGVVVDRVEEPTDVASVTARAAQPQTVGR